MASKSIVYLHGHVLQMTFPYIEDPFLIAKHSSIPTLSVLGGTAVHTPSFPHVYPSGHVFVALPGVHTGSRIGHPLLLFGHGVVGHLS